jgi:mannose-6-phosphate isomerase-like protein (cupin superfamily)
MPKVAHLYPSDGHRMLPGPAGERYARLFVHGSLHVEFYAPRGLDHQTPHKRDELYVVISGHGHFWNGQTRRSFSIGDLIFVAAGVPHRFEEFTDDFAAWVMFYGPTGGEPEDEAEAGA